jgi:hypothetical protein
MRDERRAEFTLVEVYLTTGRDLWAADIDGECPCFRLTGIGVNFFENEPTRLGLDGGY